MSIHKPNKSVNKPYTITCPAYSWSSFKHDPTAVSSRVNDIIKRVSGDGFHVTINDPEVVYFYNKILVPSQAKLASHVACRLSEMKKKGLIYTNDYVYYKGSLPVLLVAHMDTVHDEPVKNITLIGNRFLTSKQGIGGDDRCGVYSLLKIAESCDCSLLFTTEEERGGIGARRFIADEIPMDVNYMIELDRKGHNDAVFYGDANTEFHKYIETFGFVKTSGIFSDISTIAPHYGISAVNLSIGYYDCHTLNEIIDLKTLYLNIDRVKKMIAESVEKYKYRHEAITYGRYGLYDSKRYDDDWKFSWEDDLYDYDNRTRSSHNRDSMKSRLAELKEVNARKLRQQYDMPVNVLQCEPLQESVDYFVGTGLSTDIVYVNCTTMINSYTGAEYEPGSLGITEDGKCYKVNMIVEEDETYLDDEDPFEAESEHLDKEAGKWLQEYADNDAYTVEEEEMYNPYLNYLNCEPASSEVRDTIMTLAEELHDMGATMAESKQLLIGTTFMKSRDEVLNSVASRIALQAEGLVDDSVFDFYEDSYKR